MQAVWFETCSRSVNQLKYASWDVQSYWRSQDCAAPSWSGLYLGMGVGGCAKGGGVSKKVVQQHPKNIVNACRADLCKPEIVLKGVSELSVVGCRLSLSY